MTGRQSSFRIQPVWKDHVNWQPTPERAETCDRPGIDKTRKFKTKRSPKSMGKWKIVNVYLMFKLSVVLNLRQERK